MRRWTLLVAALGLLVGIEARAACDCQDTNADGYPDNNNACTGTSVTVKSTTAANEIVFTFGTPPCGGEYSCGMFANGDFWVVTKCSTPSVNIDSISPAYDGDGNGWGVNPRRVIASCSEECGTQSFDSIMPGFVAPPADLSTGSYDAVGGESVVSTVKRRVSGNCGGGGGGIAQPWNCFFFAGVLTVLDTAPTDPSNTFRPPYHGKWEVGTGPVSGASKPLFAVPALNNFPQLDITPISDTWTSIANIRDRWKMLSLEVWEHQHNNYGRQLDATGTSPAGSGEFGGDWGRDTAASWLRMALSDVDPVNDTTDRQAVINLIQTGIDVCYLMAEGDKMYPDGGGINPGGRILVWGPAFYLDAQPCKDLLANGDNWFSEDRFLTRNRHGISYSDDAGWNTAWSDTFATGGATNDVVIAGQPFNQQRKSGTTHDGSGGACENWAHTGTETTACNDQSPPKRCMDPTCLDPYYFQDGPNSVCNWDPVAHSLTRNYERMMLGPIGFGAMAARLLGGVTTYSFDEGWEYFIRRMEFGVWLSSAGNPDNAHALDSNGTCVSPDDWGPDAGCPQPEPVGAAPDLTGARCAENHGLWAREKHGGGDVLYRVNSSTNNPFMLDMYDAYWDEPLVASTDFAITASADPSSGTDTITSTIDVSFTDHVNPVACDLQCDGTAGCPTPDQQVTGIAGASHTFSTTCQYSASATGRVCCTDSDSPAESDEDTYSITITATTGELEVQQIDWHYAKPLTDPSTVIATCTCGGSVNISLQRSRICVAAQAVVSTDCDDMLWHLKQSPIGIPSCVGSVCVGGPNDGNACSATFPDCQWIEEFMPYASPSETGCEDGNPANECLAGTQCQFPERMTFSVPGTYELSATCATEDRVNTGTECSCTMNLTGSPMSAGGGGFRGAQ